MREDRCVDLLRWNDNKFKELGRKLKFRAEIGQKMTLKFDFKTAKDNYEPGLSGAKLNARFD